MTRSTLPLFPSDDGWPYPDADGPAAFDGPDPEDEPDLDALELRSDPHVFDDLTPVERELIDRRFHDARSMKELAAWLGCTHHEAADALGVAVDKVRRRLLTERD